LDQTGMPLLAPICRTRPRCGSSPPVTAIRTPSAARAKRLARFFYRHSHGAFGETEAKVPAAEATLKLWTEELAFPDLAEDIAVEARLALALTEEIKEVEERITTLVHERDPHGIITSAPGVGPITGAVRS
jgi:transposase